MQVLEKIIIHDIIEVTTVSIPKGRYIKISDRPSYGLSFCEEGQIKYTHNGNEYVSDNKHAIILPQGQNYTLQGEKSGIYYVVNFICDEPIFDTVKLYPIQNIKAFINDFQQLKKLILFPENRLKIIGTFYQMLHRLSSYSVPCNIILRAIKYI